MWVVPAIAVQRTRGLLTLQQFLPGCWPALLDGGHCTSKLLVVSGTWFLLASYPGLTSGEYGGNVDVFVFTLFSILSSSSGFYFLFYFSFLIFIYIGLACCSCKFDVCVFVQSDSSLCFHVLLFIRTRGLQFSIVQEHEAAAVVVLPRPVCVSIIIHFTSNRLVCIF